MVELVELLREIGLPKDGGKVPSLVPVLLEVGLKFKRKKHRRVYYFLPDQLVTTNQVRLKQFIDGAVNVDARMEAREWFRLFPDVDSLDLTPWVLRWSNSLKICSRRMRLNLHSSPGRKYASKP